jgi:hypothetical protein
MELNKLKSPLVKAAFQCGDEALNLELDVDILTPNFMRAAQERDAKAETGRFDMEDVDFMLNILDAVVKKWDLTENGIAILPSRKVLSGFTLKLLTDLFEFVMETAFPKKPKTGETPASPTTSETTAAGSSQEAAPVAAPTTLPLIG